MAKKRNKKTATKGELEERRQQIEALKAEAKSFGVYITSDRLVDVARVVAKIRKSREGKPPCYWRSYEKVARECRICEVRLDCARGESVPTSIATDELKPVACRKCGSGNLAVELEDQASGAVVDYGCTNCECTGRLSDQHRHVAGAKVAKKTTKTKPEAERIRSGKGCTLDELRHTMIEFVRTHPGCSTRLMLESVTGAALRKQAVMKDLVAQAEIRSEKVGKQIRYFIA